MDITLSPGQQLLRAAARDLLEKEVDLKHVRDLEIAGEMDHALWRQLSDLGWLGLPLAEAHGGGGGTLVDLALVVEELCRRAAAVPFAEVLAAAVTLERHGAADHAALLAASAAGEAIIVPAVLDDGDSYERLRGGDVDGGRLRGRRISVDWGQFATGYLVAVAANGSESLAFASAGPTVSSTPLVTVSRTPAADVTFDRTPIVAATGEPGRRFLAGLGRALSAIQCLGYAQKAFDLTTEYVKTRVQFGRPLGSFQAVQHHCANMAIMLESTRFLAYEAIWTIDAGTATAERLALAKGWAARTAVEVTSLAHQLHGGIGITTEYDLHLFSRRAKERSIAWGTTDEALDLLAGTIDQPIDWLH